MPQRFGDFATWTGSIGTVAAFSIAFLQVHKERKHRIARELDDRLRARREHADRVTAWFVEDEVVIANRSGHPIHDVKIALPALSPAAEHRGEPDAAHTIVLPHVIPGETRAPTTVRHENRPPILTFTDARGDRWRREPGQPPTHHLEG
ncbi:MAG: hypothetical protein Q4P23_15470 [Micrococcaceae bacterium]|nr:hypothetical protein [Micrococcaceae bacterium]